MPFTTEELVRLKLQLTNTAAVTPELIADAIAEAHDAVLARLDPAIDVEAPPSMLVTGETHLAGAITLRALAAREAAEQRQVTIGGQRFDTTARHGILMEAADAQAREAWELLAAFLVPPPGTAPATCTDTTPMLGAS